MNAKVPLYLGVAILLCFLVVMIVPGWFADYNPYGMLSLRSWTTESGSLAFAAPPYGPDDVYRIGSDALGRDVWSLVVYGARLTLLIGASVALLRLGLALLLGMVAGFDLPGVSGFNRRMNTVFNAVPPLIIAIILLKLRFFASLPRIQSIQAFIAVLTFVGWSRLGEVIEDRTREILSRPYIASEVAIGKRRMRIALTNVLPHLLPEMAVLLCFEIARVLTMMLQLGIFQVFVGNIQIIQSTDFGRITTRPIGYEPEWASMLAVTRTYIRTAPWIIIPPALAFTFSILGFNLVGEGLRARFQYRIEGRKRTGRKRMAVATALAIALLVFTGLAGLHDADAFEAQTQSWVEESHVTCGVNALAVAESLAERLEDAGLSPIRDAYLHDYNIAPVMRTTAATLQVDGVELVYGEDFIITGTRSHQFEGTVRTDGTLEVLSGVLPEDAEGRIIRLDSRLYRFETMMNYAIALTRETEAAGILIEIPQDEAFTIPEMTADMEGVILIVREGLIPEEARLEGAVEVVASGGKGVNVIGMIEGAGGDVGGETVVIGIRYNILNTASDHRLEWVMDWIHQLGSLETPLNQSVVFIFYDGTEGALSDGKTAYLNRPLHPANDTSVYLDLDFRRLSDGLDAGISSEGIAIGDYFGWSFRYSLLQEALTRGFAVEQSHGLNACIRGFMEKGIPSVHVSLDSGAAPEDLFGWLTATLQKNDF